MDKFTSSEKNVNQELHKSRVSGRASDLSSMRSEGYTDGQLDGINYSDGKIQATVKNQERHINYVIKTQSQKWKNLEIKDLDKYYKEMHDRIQDMEKQLRNHIKEKITREELNHGSEKHLHRAYENAANPYSQNFKDLNVQAENLETEYQKAKKEIFNDQLDSAKQYVEKWRPEVEKINRHEIQRLEEKIEKERSDLAKSNQLISEHGRLKWS